MGEWIATEYMVWQEADDGSLERVDSLYEEGSSLTMTFTEDRQDAVRGDVDLVDEHDIMLIFTDDTWAMIFDPPLPGVSEHGAAAVISGSYELLSDSRMLLVFERAGRGTGCDELLGDRHHADVRQGRPSPN